VLIIQEKIAEKIHKHLELLGMKTEMLSPLSVIGPSEGASTMGAMQVDRSSIDYVDIVRRKVVEESSFAPGGLNGLGITEYTAWKLRFFLKIPPTISLGPLNIGTLTKVLKGRFHSKVEDFVWSGYGKLTTLPPGIVNDDVIAILNSDSELRNLMMKSLLKEKVITISTYSHKVDIEQTGEKQSLARLIISSDWKPEKSLFIDEYVLQTYERIATDVKGAIQKLRYVLENY